MSKYLLSETSNTTGFSSVTQVNSFLRCQHQWYLKYVKKISPKFDSSYFSIGNACHKAMEAVVSYYGAYGTVALGEGFRAITRYFESFAVQYENQEISYEQSEQAKEDLSTANEVFLRCIDNFNLTDYEIVKVGKQLAVELHFRLPFKFHGFIDCIATNKITGCTWLIDWKFQSSLTDEDKVQYSYQQLVYAIASKYLKKDISGIMQVQVLNKPYTKPKLNKDGSASRAKIFNTWNNYRKFLAENNLNPDDYEQEMVPKLAEVESYRELTEFVNPMQAELLEQELINTYKQMKQIKKHYPKSISMIQCPSCPYNILCQAELNGQDTENIIKIQYEVKQ